jgi:shikimate dehydrogenase
MIRGTTKFYPVIGSPVAQVRAPSLYNPYFERTGIDAAVIPIEVPPETFKSYLRTLLSAPNIPGAMITVPHKRATVELLDDCSMTVKVAGSCNAVQRRPDGSLYGDLFDGAGFVRGLRRYEFDPSGKTCLIVGAGGVGAAIAASLAEARVKSIALFDVSTESTGTLAARLRQYFPEVGVAIASNDAAGYDLVVNGTPLGMKPADPLPMDLSNVSPKTLVADAVMKPDMTALLKEALARGCKIQLGREMLIEQAPLYLKLFGFGEVSSDELRPDEQ